MGRGGIEKHLLSEQLLVTLAHRTPGLEDGSVLLGVLEDLLLLVEGVNLALVDGRDHVEVVHQVQVAVRVEVEDVDGADLALLQEGLQGLVGLDGGVEGARRGLVEDEQVDVVQAQLGRGLLPGVEGLLVAVVGDPDLRLDEDLLARDAGFRDGLAHLALIEVRGGGVDVAVADLEGLQHGGLGFFGGRLKDAEALGGHLEAVVQRDQGPEHSP